MSGTLQALAAAPVARRQFDVAPEPMIPAGVPAMQRQGPSQPLDTTDPTALMMLRAGIGQTEQQTSRLWQLATDMAMNTASTTPMRGIRAYHGSPHDFDRFDISRAGSMTGLGLPGHYFAEAEARARNSAPRGGRLYEVRLNVDPASLLDMDAAIANQPQARDALAELVERGTRYFGMRNPTTASEALGVASRAAGHLDMQRLGVPREMVPVEMLRRAGVPGARIIDQGHGTASPLRNYIMFDDNMIEILRKAAVE